MLKRFICLKNVIILSICISWNNSFMLSTWKQLFLTCAKSPHSRRKWPTVNGASQPTHCGCSSPCSKYEWVTLVWPNRSQAKTTSSLLMFRTTDWYSPIVGLMSRSLLPMLLFHEVCHSSKIYLLIDGLKLEKCWSPTREHFNGVAFRPPVLELRPPVLELHRRYTCTNRICTIDPLSHCLPGLFYKRKKSIR